MSLFRGLTRNEQLRRKWIVRNFARDALAGIWLVVFIVAAFALAEALSDIMHCDDCPYQHTATFGGK